MSRSIAPLWDSPPAEAPELQRQAHRYMMQTLKVLRARVPEVLTDPEKAGGARVMEAAMAATLNPKVPGELREAMLIMLQRRMLQADEETPKRLFLARAENQSALSRTFGEDVNALAEFELALESHLMAERPAVASLSSADQSAAAMLALGVLVTHLVTRLGCCAPALLGRATQALSQSPWVAGPWVWVDVDLSEPARGTSQLRRLFLDPIGLAAWIRAREYEALLPKPRLDLKAGKRAAFYIHRAKRAFKALCEALEARRRQPLAIGSLKALCHAQAQRLHLTTMPLLATYAQGNIASSSLETSTWLRLIGYLPPAKPQQVRTDLEALEAEGEEEEHGTELALPLTGIDPGAGASLAEQLERGDLEENGLIASLRLAMAGPRASWRERLDALVNELEAQGPDLETARCVVSWLRHLAFERQNKGHALRDGSVLNYRGMLANRLLQSLPSRLSELDAEELLDAYLDVIMSRRSLEQTPRIRAALSSFDRYVRTEHLANLPFVKLPGFETGSYSISSRIIVDQEFYRGLELIHQGDMAFPDPELARQTKAFWVLAYRFGLRRREILGLQVRDMDFDVIRIRKNASRALKTANAHRVVPLHAITRREQRMVLCLAEGRPLEEFVFYGRATPTAKTFDAHPVVLKINDLLERVTGDRRLHPHNLRHSTATLTLLGTLGRDLGLARHPYATCWMKSSLHAGARIEEAVSGDLHRKGARGSALAVLMGHGSELTTYEHYVHSLDLLLFLACWDGRFNDRAPARLGPRRKNNALLVALLGYAPSTRVDTRDIPALLRRMSERYPENFILLEPAEDHPYTQAPSVQVIPAPQPWSLQPLRDIPGASTWRGFPSAQAELDSVNLLLKQLTPIGVARSRLRSVFARWIDAQIKNSDWASMAPDTVRRWVQELTALAPGIGLEAMHVRQEHRNKKRKVPVAMPADCASYGEPDGRYWVRLADGRPKVDERKRQTERRRSRTQESISWLLRAIATLEGSSAMPCNDSGLPTTP